MNSKYSSRAFFVEIMVDILVFSLAMALFSGVFAKASVLTREAREEGLAAAEMAALLETAKQGGLQALPQGVQGVDGLLCFYYDEAWQPQAAEGAAYIIQLAEKAEAQPAGTLFAYHAEASRADGSPLGTKSAYIYRPLPKEAADE